MLGEGRRKRKAQEAEKKRLDTLLRELGYVRQRDIDDKKDKERKTLELFRTKRKVIGIAVSE